MGYYELTKTEVRKIEAAIRRVEKGTDKGTAEATEKVVGNGKTQKVAAAVLPKKKKTAPKKTAKRSTRKKKTTAKAA